MTIIASQFGNWTTHIFVERLQDEWPTFLNILFSVLRKDAGERRLTDDQFLVLVIFSLEIDYFA